MEKLVIGVIRNYNFDQVEPWLNSLRMTGYDGEILVIDASTQPNIELKDVLTLMGVHYWHMVASGPQNFMVTRFILLYVALAQYPFNSAKYVLTTDVRDVIFQEDPTSLMSRPRHVVIMDEGLTYQDEPWSMNNFIEVMGSSVYEEKKNHWIKCAGVIAGRRLLLRDLFLSIYTMSLGLQQYPKGGGGPDQTVMNIILGTEPWYEVVDYDDRILHAGTSRYAVLSGKGEIGFRYMQSEDKEKFMQAFLDLSMQAPASLKDGKIVSDKTGKPFTIVHQYDRVDEWRDLDKQYRKITNA